MDLNQTSRCIWDILCFETDVKIKARSGSSTTGVTIEGNYILSCAHGWTSLDAKIFGRNRDKKVTVKLETVYVRHDCDLRLLKITKDVKEKLPYLQISNNENLSAGEMVYAMGHPRRFNYTMCEVRVAFPSIEVSPECFSTSLTCSRYVVDLDNKRPRYRTLGDMFNKQYFDLFDHLVDIDDQDCFGKNSNPLLPVIYYIGECSPGFSGGPLLTRGEKHIIGITSCGGGFCNYGVAVHVSAIKVFLAEARAYEKKGKKRPTESAPVSASKKSLAKR